MSPGPASRSTDSFPGAPEACGLSAAEAALRLAADGANVLPGSAPRSGLAIVLKVVMEPMFLLLRAAGTTYLTLGNPACSIVFEADSEAGGLLAAALYLPWLRPWRARWFFLRPATCCAASMRPSPGVTTMHWPMFRKPPCGFHFSDGAFCHE